jgi:hypothetical protein
MSSTSATNGRHTEAGSLDEQCGVLRDLHVPGRPLVLPNAWDAATARAVVSAGFPVVATTSGGVAASLGYEDHEGAPAAEMLGAAARIAKSVDVPLTVDAEAGYGLNPEELVDALRETGAAGCNLEDSNHREGRIRDADEHAEWLRAVRQAASRNGYPLVINARIDVFLAELLAGSKRPQRELVPEALHLPAHTSTPASTASSPSRSGSPRRWRSSSPPRPVRSTSSRSIASPRSRSSPAWASLA